MKMHGLHGFSNLEYFKDKTNNEVIVLLEEMIRNEKLLKELQELKSNANHKTSCEAEEMTTVG
jgi:hypothetical protein